MFQSKCEFIKQTNDFIIIFFGYYMITHSYICLFKHDLLQILKPIFITNVYKLLLVNAMKINIIILRNRTS